MNNEELGLFTEMLLLEFEATSERSRVIRCLNNHSRMVGQEIQKACRTYNSDENATIVGMANAMNKTECGSI